MSTTPDIAEFDDPRLAAVYETVNAYDPDAQPGFYLELAAEVAPALIVDLGCGTGLITRELARQGHEPIGIDRSSEMIEIARHRPFGSHVRWIVGDAVRVGTPDADLAIMTGHVAQFFITDEDWNAALVALHGALRPGGRLAFESRNPEAREWECWNRATGFTVDDPTAGAIETWTEIRDRRDGVVSYTNHYAFAATGDELVSHARLRFRTEVELNASLADAGFTVERIFGDWDRRPAGPTTRELIVVASR